MSRSTREAFDVFRWIAVVSVLTVGLVRPDEDVGSLADLEGALSSTAQGEFIESF